MNSFAQAIRAAEVMGPADPIWKNDQDNTSIEGVLPNPPGLWCNTCQVFHTAEQMDRNPFVEADDLLDLDFDH